MSTAGRCTTVQSAVAGTMKRRSNNIISNGSVRTETPHPIACRSAPGTVRLVLASFSSHTIRELPLQCRHQPDKLRELGMGTSTTGSLGRGRPRAKHPADFYTCPGCKGAVYSITRDLYGNPLYDCPKCHRRFDARALEHHYRRQHPGKLSATTTQSRRLPKTMGGHADE
jgi:hypothetical protein